MTASERLVFLSGLSGVSAGAHMYAIRNSGVTSGEMLVSRSSLVTASAALHLLDGGSVGSAAAPSVRGFMSNMGTFMGMR